MNQDRYIHLLYQQLQGNLSSAEEKDLQEWLQLSEENRAIGKSIQLSWQLLDDFEPELDLDIAADYGKVRQQMQIAPPTQRPSPVVPLRNRRNWLAIAASIVFLLGAGFLFRFFQTTPSPMIVLQTGADEIKEVLLSDNSKVWLNENSQLTYPEQFGANSRLVEMSGEAFFDISPDAQKPFKINTTQATVSVLGTSFNVKAYPQEQTTSVSVATGKVNFSASKSQEGVLLRQDEAATLTHSNTSFEKTANTNLNATSWKTGSLSFKGQHLKAVFKTLEKHFDVVIENKNPSLETCLFSMPAQKVSLDQIFQNLKILYQIEVKMTTKQHYLLSGGQCG